MTKLLIWRNEWSLGIDALDADHRALVGTLIDISLRFCHQAALPADLPGRAKAPVTPVSSGAPAADLIEALVGFGVKAQAHFRREEAFMRAIHYAQSEQHAAEHAVLVSQFKAMLRDWRGRAITVFDDAARERVCQWLLTHILESDRRFAKVYFDLCGLTRPGPGPG
jgi:hemerythrin